MSDILLSGRDIQKIYTMGEVKVSALRGVSFDISEGEFIVVLGPSGSGKSTMLNIIGGMDTPTSGELLHRGRALHNACERELTLFRRNVVGFVFQFYNLMPNLTALENVALPCEIVKNPLPALDLLARVNLESRAGHFPAQLSGGEQQRVAIARALAKNPSILLCDEPTGALDVTTGIGILQILKDFNREFNKTVIIITHNAGIAAIADKVFHITDGLIDKSWQNQNPVSAQEVVW